MKFSSALVILSSTAFAFAQDTSLAEVKRVFEAADGTSAYRLTPPSCWTFPSLRPPASLTLHAGVQLPRNATAGPPIFNVLGSRSRGPFVVAAVDLDAPTPQAPTSAQIRHFLGGNFVLKTPHEPTLLSNSTPALTEFHQPTPPAGSDPHRYVFLLFDQFKEFKKQTLVNASTSISNFNISSFSHAVDLGAPIGGTFMLVGPDPSTT